MVRVPEAPRGAESLRHLPASALEVREEAGDAESARGGAQKHETEAQAQSPFEGADGAERRVEKTEGGEPDPEAAQGLIGSEAPGSGGRRGIEETLHVRAKTSRLGREHRQHRSAQRHERKRHPQREQHERRQQTRAPDGKPEEEPFSREVELYRGSSAGARQEDLDFGTRLSPGVAAQREEAREARELRMPHPEREPLPGFESRADGLPLLPRLPGISRHDPEHEKRRAQLEQENRPGIVASKVPGDRAEEQYQRDGKSRHRVPLARSAVSSLRAESFPGSSRSTSSNVFTASTSSPACRSVRPRPRSAGT